MPHAQPAGQMVRQAQGSARVHESDSSAGERQGYEKGYEEIWSSVFNARIFATDTIM